jgi:antitoxin component of MazEF toxin-antitoxin module
VIELKISRIGNSRGIRLPATLLARYGMHDVVVVEQGADAITLRPKDSKKLSWKETATAMARERGNWTDLDPVIADGLDSL